MKRDLSKEKKENLRQLRRRWEDGFSTRSVDNQAKFKNEEVVNSRENRVGQKDHVVTAHYVVRSKRRGPEHIDTEYSKQSYDIIAA